MSQSVAETAQKKPVRQKKNQIAAPNLDGITDQQIITELKDWAKLTKPYQQTNKKKQTIQILNSFLPYLAINVLMYYTLNVSLILTFFLAFLAAFFLVRIFIIQHDCGHMSFFAKKDNNDTLGFIASLFTTFPYKYWARSHSFHHAHNGQLEDREIGDINTLTVEEYKEKNPSQRFFYRLYRNPFILFILGLSYYLMVPLRFPMVKKKGWEKTKRQQLINNIILVALYASLTYLIGWDFLKVQLPIFAIYAVIALWFFYVQHQHEFTYKQWKKNWNYVISAIRGSSFYKLPKIFNWLTGNIGYHHIHHLNSRIPNYNLIKCSEENPILNKYVNTLTFSESLSCVFNHLWDEKEQRMISFAAFRKMEKQGLV
ncbi:MAG: fatty acid desaturase [Flavobacteriales bacterium]|jgi:omega-6 fatty acid desaturase (delta-12 desaturase)|nr:fatty acid desaturase [Flavobacteriales bacterium]